MTDSILNSVKKQLGIAADYTEFDVDIRMHINSALSTLHQLGIGPPDGFLVEDQTDTWTQLLLGDNRINSVKTYISLKVRLLFDPPTTSFTITEMEKQIIELEWRLNVVREYSIYGTTSDVDGVLPNPDNVIIDGGEA